MKNITAYNFFTDNLVQSSIDEDGNYSLYDIENAMIGFAKLKVKEALDAAADVVGNEIEKDFITRDTILNAYSLETIK